MMRFFMEAYGCTMNQGEARMVSDMMQARGWSSADSIDDADLVFLVTCTVIGTTERRMLKRLSSLNGMGKPLVVAGCMPEVQAGKIMEIAPHSNLLGVHDLEKNLPELVSRLEKDTKPAPSIKAEVKERFIGIIPIAQGCSGRCTYCIAKLARGELSSYSPELIMTRLGKELDMGAKELRVTALDTASYGTDFGSSLPLLLKRVSNIKGDFRIRVGMANPDTVLPVLDELVDAYRNEKVFKFLHLPVQSGNDDMIRRMGRDYGVDDFRSIVDTFRDEFDDLTLSTDIIVGFPGETEENFLDSLDLIDEVRPDIVNVTRFSPRPGTPAAKLEGAVVGRIVKERSRRLNSLRAAVASSNSEVFIGREEGVLTLERGKNDSTVGRTDAYRTAVIPQKLPLGEFMKIKVVGHVGFYLIGERI